MTPTQLVALQALRGAEMPITTDEQAEIAACFTPLGRDDAAIAAVLSRGRKRVQQPTYIGSGTVSDVIGVQAGGPLVVLTLYRIAHAAETMPDAAFNALPLTPPPDAPPGTPSRIQLGFIHQAVERLRNGNLDIGLLSVREAMPVMAGQIPGLTQEAIAGILARAEHDNPISQQQVTACLLSAGE